MGSTMQAEIDYKQPPSAHIFQGLAKFLRGKTEEKKEWRLTKISLKAKKVAVVGRW